jgi:hypothetical protein
LLSRPDSGLTHLISFVSRGPDGAFPLAAQNFETFMRMAAGVDDATWLHHLHQHDDLHWLRDTVKDGGPAREVEAIENGDSSPEESRQKIFSAIRPRYAAAA